MLFLAIYFFSFSVDFYSLLFSFLLPNFVLCSLLSSSCILSSGQSDSSSSFPTLSHSLEYLYEGTKHVISLKTKKFQKYKMKATIYISLLLSILIVSFKSSSFSFVEFFTYFFIFSICFFLFFQSFAPSLFKEKLLEHLSLIISSSSYDEIEHKRVTVVTYGSFEKGESTIENILDENEQIANLQSEDFANIEKKIQTIQRLNEFLRKMKRHHVLFLLFFVSRHHYVTESSSEPEMQSFSSSPPNNILAKSKQIKQAVIEQNEMLDVLETSVQEAEQLLKELRS